MNVFDELKKQNPTRSDVTIRIYADALQTYCEAAANVRKHGAIVQHPRTGQPIDNPQLKVRDSSAKTLQSKSLRLIQGDVVMVALIEELSQ